MSHQTKSEYERDGYFIANWPVIPAEVIARAVAGQDAIMRGEYDTGRPPETSPWKPGDPPNKLVKIEQPQFANRAIMDLLRHSALGEFAAQVTGAEKVQVWWVQMLVKPAIAPGATAATNVGWHQDRTYWRDWTDDSELFTAWVALSDVTMDSGPMCFVPGSHQWGLVEGSNFYSQEGDALKDKIKTPAGAEWREVAAVLPPGGMSFHRDLTMHGSGPNTSGRLRRSLAVHLRTGKSRPKSNEQRGLTRYADDENIAPVIYRRK